MPSVPAGLFRPPLIPHSPLLTSETLPLSLLTLFLTFLHAGGLTVGSGYATVSPLRRAIVEKNGWMTDDDFSRHLAVALSMPGVFNVNLAAFLGRQLMGWRGCAACLAGMVLPAFTVFIVFATFFDDLRALPAVESFLRGARPAIVALIALPCLQMWRKSQITISTVWIPVGAAVAVGLLGVSPVYIIAGLVLLGVLYGTMVQDND